MDMQWFKGMRKSMVLMRSISIKVIQYQIIEIKPINVKYNEEV